VTLRAPTPDDVAATVALINATSQRLRGRDDVDEAEIRGWWTQPPPFDVERDVVLAVREGHVVGCGDIGDQAHDGAVLWLDVRGEAIAEVHAEVERRALERRATRGSIRASVDANDDQYHRVLAAREYEPIRSSYRMVVDLEGRDLVPIWPEGAAVRPADEETDASLLHELAERAFEDHWGYTPTPYEEWLHWHREMGTADPSLWFVASVGDAPAGVAICRGYTNGDPRSGWVSQLGVLREHRGRGLGTALLTHAFAVFRERSLERARLSVDAENTTGAVGLYERIGMTVEERRETWELRR
jgi:ribosomal protein S18 acetylase RimI-like enzyme